VLQPFQTFKQLVRCGQAAFDPVIHGEAAGLNRAIRYGTAQACAPITSSAPALMLCTREGAQNVPQTGQCCLTHSSDKWSS
jgi:hypothetical protein